MKRIIYLTILFLLILGPTYNLYPEGKTIEEIQAEQKKKEPKKKEVKKVLQPKKKKIEIPVIKKIPTFDKSIGNKINLLEIDPALVAQYNEAVKIERAHQKEAVSPKKAIEAWVAVVKVETTNPFLRIGRERLKLWLGYDKYVGKYNSKKKASLLNIKKMIPISSLNYKLKEKAVAQYLTKYSTKEGLKPLFNILVGSNLGKQLLSSRGVKDLSRKIILVRCENGISNECYTCSTFYKKGGLKNKKYLEKACSLKHVEACTELNVILKTEKAELAKKTEIKRKMLAEKKKELLAKEKEKRRIEKEVAEKRKKEELRMQEIDKELSLAGGKKRRTLAVVSLVSGIVLGVGGGVFLSRLPVIRKNQDISYRNYMSATDQDKIDKYKAEVIKYNRLEDIAKVFSGIGIGLGAILATTGIVLFAVDSKGEKEIKKKYNMSLYVNPFGQSIGLTLKY